MSILFNWVFIIAYFSVFIVGLFGCFNLSKQYWVARSMAGNTVFVKRALTIKATSTGLLGFCAIVGLIQAIKGA
ncbi:hypothetical protein EC844_12653 [Acinetobacter calcoaceticus]|uniref:Uncharacterized protein n=1 Tax=Acinetobacter calcoaceticus TaxID=471 RepID=A0A4R1XFP7_ACICA|nr:hypothetical protein EC844_12653 [Acinetobacter calcoaceticus]